jgi:hypothetical protein
MLKLQTLLYRSWLQILHISWQKESRYYNNENITTFKQQDLSNFRKKESTITKPLLLYYARLVRLYEDRF